MNKIQFRPEKSLNISGTAPLQEATRIWIKLTTLEEYLHLLELPTLTLIGTTRRHIGPWLEVNV